jgi:hypothetical protein
VGTDQHKFSVPLRTWGEFNRNPERNLKLMTRRCETDVILVAASSSNEHGI